VTKGGIAPAKKAITTSKPADRSLNPEGIEIAGATELLRWDFRDDTDANQWQLRNNLRVELRSGKAYLVGTGADPQLAIELTDPVMGQLAIELKARPTKQATPQFFWASPKGQFNAGQQYQRTVNSADEIQTYLFPVGDQSPLQKLRFDPFSGADEMEVQTLTIYRLSD
jgi:hypothetical protein